MQRFTDLTLILKSFAYQERDRIIVGLTEEHGKITALAKGATSSKRYGGSLGFLSCSKIQFIQKPHSEMARIEEARLHHEFSNLHLDFDRLTAASFAAEFCMRMVEPETPAREIFLILSNSLYQLDRGLSLQLVINAFLAKILRVLGYDLRNILDESMLFYFYKLAATPFKELQFIAEEPHRELFHSFSDFIHHHLPGVPSNGFASFKLLNDAISRV